MMRNSACWARLCTISSVTAGLVTIMGKYVHGWVAGRLNVVLRVAAVCGMLLPGNALAQSIRIPWNDYARDSQHSALSPIASQPLHRIVWQTSLDLSVATNNTGELFIHFGSPLITRSNTVIVPVKTTGAGAFRIESRVGATGATNWMKSTDYILPPHNWTPSFSPALTPNNRLYFPGIGGTVYYCDAPDSTNLPAFGQLAFYGLTNYTANPGPYQSNVYINTPITSDRYGNVFFGFQVTGSTPLNLQGGIARIDVNGTGSWMGATNVSGDTAMTKVVMNCAPALANDHRTLYFAVNSGNFSYGYLVSVDSRTLAPMAHYRLKDAGFPTHDAALPDDGTASPTVGPDGDVYFGVFEYSCCVNHDRGWLLHFNSALSQTNIPGAFGWDDTASILPASLVASYHGSSSYLLVTKYNNYSDGGIGGDGSNKVAVLDPRATETDPVTGASVMKEILTIVGPTPNTGQPGVREWCINTAAVDPFTKSVLVNNEDGKMYRWDLTSNTLSETFTLTTGVGEAYTPTLIGVDGKVYAVNNAILFALGQ